LKALGGWLPAAIAMLTESRPGCFSEWGDKELAAIWRQNLFARKQIETKLIGPT
jgi:hypothetical protein